MPEPIYFFWGIVALLALAAGYNQMWHHAGDNNPSTRLTRAVDRAEPASHVLTRSAPESGEIAR